MPLWRVDINHLAHRFVEADSAQEATSLVGQALLAGFDLSASPANRTLTRAYYDAGPIVRRRLLASLDGLQHPMRTATDRKSTRRKLARLIQYDAAAKAWGKDALRQAPALPRPEGVDRLLEGSEMAHLRRSMARLRDDEANSPFHS